MSAWDDPALSGGVGEVIARDLRDMVLGFENSRERNHQVSIGPSAIGGKCVRCLARFALGMRLERQFTDPWCAIIGTAVHAWLESAAQHSNELAGEEWWLTEHRVHPHPDEMPSGGNADLFDVNHKTVIDHKIVGTEQVKKYRHNGPGYQYRAQAQLYGLGFARTGKDVENVGIAFWPRGGRLSGLYVWTEPYQPQIALGAIERYRVIKEQALAIGPAILPHLPAHPDCWDCGGKDVSADELAVITQLAKPNVA